MTAGYPVVERHIQCVGVAFLAAGGIVGMLVSVCGCPACGFGQAGVGRWDLREVRWYGMLTQSREHGTRMAYRLSLWMVRSCGEIDLRLAWRIC